MNNAWGAEINYKIKQLAIASHAEELSCAEQELLESEILYWRRCSADPDFFIDWSGYNYADRVSLAVYWQALGCCKPAMLEGKDNSGLETMKHFVHAI